MTSKQFVELLNEVSNSYEARSYSGRAMYGKKCVAIRVDGQDTGHGLVARAMARIVKIIDSEEDDNNFADTLNRLDSKLQELVGIFSRTRSDNLGLDTIFYWPNMEWTKDLDEEEVDEEN